MATLTDEQIYEMLKDLPDFDRLPLPKYFYEKFNIPPPKILSIREALQLQYNTMNAPGLYVKTEFREPASGGLRIMPESEPLKIEVKQGEYLEDAPKTEVIETSEGRSSQVQSDLHK